MGTIAERITQARTDLNINQKELAKRADITEANLSRYENGVREPKSAVLARLADALEVTTDYLVGLTDEKNYDAYDITKQSDDDILKTLQDLESRLNSKESGLTFCGQPASKEAIDGILHSIRAGIILAVNDTKTNK